MIDLVFYCNCLSLSMHTRPGHLFASQADGHACYYYLCIGNSRYSYSVKWRSNTMQCIQKLFPGSIQKEWWMALARTFPSM
jgi:hypothetical protein